MNVLWNACNTTRSRTLEFIFIVANNKKFLTHNNFKWETCSNKFQAHVSLSNIMKELLLYLKTSGFYRIWASFKNYKTSDLLKFIGIRISQQWWSCKFFIFHSLKYSTTFFMMMSIKFYHGAIFLSFITSPSIMEIEFQVKIDKNFCSVSCKLKLLNQYALSYDIHSINFYHTKWKIQFFIPRLGIYWMFFMYDMWKLSHEYFMISVKICDRN